MRVRVEPASPDDVPALAVLRTAVANQLTRDFGTGHWSSLVTEAAQAESVRRSGVFVAKAGDEIIGTLRLATKKPWAIDPAYFTTVIRPLYLTDMAVSV